MKTHFIRLSDYRVISEDWIDRQCRYQITQQIRDQQILRWLVIDKKEGEFLAEEFTNIYEARGFVDQLIQEEDESNGHGASEIGGDGQS